MNQTVFSFGIAGIVLLTGVLLRAKVKVFQKILMPAPVIGGVVGLILINLLGDYFPQVSTSYFSEIVNVFFVFSFIAIGLSGNGNKKEKLTREEKKKLTKIEKRTRRQNGVVAGSFSLGLVWCAIYGLLAIVGGLVCAVVGKPFGMDAVYGVLLSFGFAQGPGQAATYGQLFEGTYGFENAEMISIAFSVIGFLVAFALGVPLARYGLKKGYSNSNAKIDEIVERGYYKPDEEGESLGRATTYGGNVETLATHAAFIGLSYVIAIGFSKLIAYVPGIGETLSAMTFFWGMIAASIIKVVLRTIKVDYILDDRILSSLTGFLTDFTVVAAFMSVKLKVLGAYLIPIVVISAVCSLLAFFVSLYFGARMGSDHDFERILGLYGTSTGTVSSGVSLIRIIDPTLQTTTAVELGGINMVGILSAPVITFLSLAGLGKLLLWVALGGIAISVIIDFAVLKISGGWNKEASFRLEKSNQTILQGEG